MVLRSVAFLFAAAAGLALGASAIQVTPAAQAAGYQYCAANTISGMAEGHGIIHTNARVTRMAIANWAANVAVVDGTNWTNWDHARDSKVHCKRVLFTVNCEVSAKPCRG
jgi:hypothetical protein